MVSATLTAWCVLLTAILPQGGISMKMVRVSVPQYTLRGETVELLCQFELQGDRLYSVTWYHDNDEFYRFVPKNTPPQLTYWIDGIIVDKLRSDSQKVVIRNVPLKASGMYRCEVSGEAPNFSSVHGEAEMSVVSLPQEGPQISGEERMYQVGDEINLNCTSAKSFPPARLRWYLNEQPVESDYEAVVQHHGLLSSTAGLRFQVGPEHFRRGRLQVRCVATISAAAAAPLHSPHHHHTAEHPTALDYSKEALFSVTGGGGTAQASWVAMWMTSLLVTSLKFT